ncbi:MAG: hypothetical protein U0T82_09045 [Bacteroidales bacterium]
MKKLTFLYLISIAFQGTIMAQTSFGVSTGASTWWAKCNKPIVSSEVSPDFNLGLFFEYPIFKNLFLKTEFDYAYLIKNYSYKAVVDSVNWVIVGDEESATNYQQFSVQTQVAIKLGAFKPFIGTEYSYRISESWLNKSISSFGLTGGVNYLVSDRLSLGLRYYQGLTKDYEYSGSIVNPINDEYIGEYHNYWKSRNIGIILNYSIGSKE